LTLCSSGNMGGRNHDVHAPWAEHCGIPRAAPCTPRAEHRHPPRAQPVPGQPRRPPSIWKASPPSTAMTVSSPENKISSGTTTNILFGPILRAGKLRRRAPFTWDQTAVRSGSRLPLLMATQRRQRWSHSQPSDASFTRCVFGGNIAGRDGGALDVYRAPLIPRRARILTLSFEYCSFNGNRAGTGAQGWGGGAHFQDVNATFTTAIRPRRGQERAPACSPSGVT